MGPQKSSVANRGRPHAHGPCSECCVKKGSGVVCETICKENGPVGLGCLTQRTRNSVGGPGMHALRETKVQKVAMAWARFWNKSSVGRRPCPALSYSGFCLRHHRGFQSELDTGRNGHLGLVSLGDSVTLAGAPPASKAGWRMLQTQTLLQGPALPTSTWRLALNAANRLPETMWLK